MQTDDLKLKRVFTDFAQNIGATVCQSIYEQTVSYINLESQVLNDGYLRLCIAPAEDIFIIEVGLHLSSILPDSFESIEKLMTLHALASPCQTHKRFFPTIDLPNQHLILSYIVGSQAIHHENDLFNLLESCTNEVTELRQSLRKNLNMAKSGNSGIRSQSLFNTTPTPNHSTLLRSNATLLSQIKLRKLNES